MTRGTKRAAVAGAGAFLLLGIVAIAQAPPPAAPSGPGRIVQFDPALEKIVSTTATIEKVVGGLGFTEGPVWSSRDKALFFSDIPGNAIHKLQNGQDSIFRGEIFKGSGYPPSFNVGPNGLTFDKEGRLIVCEHSNRQIERLEKNGTWTVIADKYEGKRLNSPNDAVVKSDGAIYFTDPPYGLAKGDADPAKELSFDGVFRLKDGALTLLATPELTKPNGLAFSPDEKSLYVGNSDAQKRIWMRYEVKADGTLGAGNVHYDLAGEQARGIPDGFKVDAAGNLMGSGPGGVWVISPAGKLLGRIETPETPANLAFGEDGRTLFITARTSVYKVRLTGRGRVP